MSRELVCVSNSLTDVSSCVFRDEHATGCDGWEYSWTPARARFESTGGTCRGCLPREASHGVLCGPCFRRTREALDDVERWLTAMEGVEVAVRRDNGGVRSRSGPPIPISPVQLAVDEVQSFYRSFPGDLDMWVATLEGGEAAVRFTRAALAAFTAHPIAEEPARVQRIRCPRCERLNLLWRPPAYAGALVAVVCQTPECGMELDQPSFEMTEVIAGRRRA